MANTLKTVLLLALPASGKSEVRRYLASLTPQQCRDEFHLGPTVQLDDFPYVHLMRRVDDELEKLSKRRIFFQAPDASLIDARDWGTLIQLINEDYSDLFERTAHETDSAGEHLLGRLDAAGEKVGAGRRLTALDTETRAAVVRGVEHEAREQLDEKLAGYPDSLAGKTVVIEFARGGADGSTLPLESPFGYRYSLGQLSEAILQDAAVLYVWVTPEESRRKNTARTDPDDPGSILHHGVPEQVMLGDYGCDDMGWLEENSAKPGTISIQANGKTHHLPIARFDNRVDKTSFVRDEPADWKADDVAALHDGLKGALTKLAAFDRD